MFGTPQFRGRRICDLVAAFKGDATQAQSSEQVGAQDQGAAIKGDANVVNTGTQIRTAPDTISASGGSTVNVTDQGAVASAAQAVEAALQSVQDATAQALTVANNAQVAGQSLATQAVQAQPAGTDWKTLGIVALLIGFFVLQKVSHDT